VQRALRVARYAEAAYAVIAVVLAFGLQLPPSGPTTVLFAHWIGTAVLAAAIAFRLGRPNRQTWYVAALLCGYVLLNSIIAVARLLGPEAAALGRPAAVSLAVGALVTITQIAVGVCLYQARELRTMPSRIVSGR
jgi:hypothetical protein